MEQETIKTISSIFGGKINEESYPSGISSLKEKIYFIDKEIVSKYPNNAFTVSDKLMYCVGIKALTPNIAKVSLTTSSATSVPDCLSKPKLDRKNAVIPVLNEVNWFYKNCGNYIKTSAIAYVSDNGKSYYRHISNGNNYAWSEYWNHPDAAIIPIIRIHSPVAVMLKYNVSWNDLGENILNDMKLIRLFYNLGMLTADDNVNFVHNSFDEFIDYLKTKGYDVKMEEYLNEILRRDFDRCGLTPYDEKLLTDSSRGHWELWDENETKDTVKPVTLDGKTFYARNPAMDINQNSIVGIDFGTKSTVAVILDEESKYRPIRIGGGDLGKASSENQYENPTILELTDIDGFIAKYKEKKGRPDTLFNQISVSHTAYDSFKNSNNSQYKSYVTGLKKYAGGYKSLSVCDKMGKNMQIKPYSQLGDEDFDVIEIYAYYIGLYINNMYRKIFLDYMLSMPVNFDTDTKERIRLSFEKGLKKSLPSPILNNPEIMKDFRVKASINESASYAVTALTEFGFDPDEDEKDFYGVFDFGGGTTDFDFGFWRGANRSERRYDYVITYYDDEGDKTLGGENITEIIAYKVWCENLSIMAEKKIPFNLPPDCDIPVGSELLICSASRSGVKAPSDESSYNTWKLAESLRWIWEETEPASELGAYSIENDEFSFKPDLFDIEGKKKTDIELKINVGNLRKAIENRAEKGVRNFFECLRKNAKRFIKEENITDDMRINIFLAGNSSKSSVIENLFRKYIDAELENITDTADKSDYFRLFYPLGTEKADEQIRQNNPDKDDYISPNCKTGVAYGILLTRSGGKIKVIDKRSSQELFEYYIGYERKKKFIHLTDRNISYDKWYELVEADADTFELYYCAYPEAETDKLPISDTKKIVCHIPNTPDAMVYYRPVSPAEIEYTISKNCSDGVINEKDMLTEPIKLRLEP